MEESTPIEKNLAKEYSPPTYILVGRAVEYDTLLELVNDSPNIHEMKVIYDSIMMIIANIVLSEGLE